MKWMRFTIWVVVTAGIWETEVTAIIALVDMKREEAGLRIGQAAYLRNHKRSAAALEEADRSTKRRIFLLSTDMRNCCVPVILHYCKITSH